MVLIHYLQHVLGHRQLQASDARGAEGDFWLGHFVLLFGPLSRLVPGRSRIYTRNRMFVKSQERAVAGNLNSYTTQVGRIILPLTLRM